MSPAPTKVTVPLEAETVTAELPVLPSQVAVMLAVPAATPLTSPLELTVAAAVLSLDQVMVRPLSVLPPVSLGVAMSCVVPPTWTLDGDGETVTDATGTIETVTTQVPLWPSQVAVTLAVPTATPLTSPLELTVAATVLSLAQVMVRPLSVLPLPSLGVAVSCRVALTLMAAVVGET